MLFTCRNHKFDDCIGGWSGFCTSYVPAGIIDARLSGVETMKDNKPLLIQELHWFLLAIVVSFSIWCILTLLGDQRLVVSASRYSRELYGFIATVGFIYFLRASGKWVNLS